MEITKDIRYIGVDDHDIDLFEGQYDVSENGMAYNSYVILGDKIAVADSVDAGFVDEWLGNLEAALDGRTPDYLVVHHMEPDHSAGIAAFMERYPQAQIVASMGAFRMMVNYFGTDYPERKMVVKEGDVLDLGGHSLTFVGAPNVHWPEVLFSYESTDKVLFSADGFGKFGANDIEDPEGWACEARRYYFGIVGKFGKFVQAVLKKAADLDIQIICPLHGPVLTENLGYYLDTYNTWSSYQPEDDGITIAYASVYGHLKAAVEELAAALEARGQKVSVFDLARDDMAEAVEDAFRYDRLVLASITYQGEIFPFMSTFIHTLAEQGVRAITLTWNGENELGSGHTTDHGMSEFGKAAVREMEKENILVDVSHLNDPGFADLLEVATKPFVATHSNARALCSHKRNLTDDMIREMVRRNCLIGLNYFVKFLRDDGDVKSLDDLYRHAMHFFELGARKNLALGSDFDGSVLPECLNTPAKVASFYEYLLSRGVSQEDADGVFYKNAQAFFRKNLR